jgi:predicted glycosyltransferase
VDQYLTDSGRMTMIQNIDEIIDKIKVQKRQTISKQNNHNTIQFIVKRVVEMIEGTSTSK